MSFRSELLKSPPCSVIQGSKLSATLYTIFINEVTIIHKIIDKEIGRVLIGGNNYNFIGIDHITICYVDDATCIISCKDINILKLYMDTYYKLLEFA